MSVTLPNVPDAPGVPSVARTGLSLVQALDGLSSSSAMLTQLSGLASIVSTDASGKVLTAATTITTAAATLSSAATMVEQAKALSGIDRAGSLAGAAGSVVGIIDPVLGGQIAGVANTVVSLASAIRQIAPGNEQKLSSDSDTVASVASSEWGIYTTDGLLAIECDSIVSVSYRGEQVLPDFPLEQGSFETYDKVERPFVTPIRVTRGGAKGDRAIFLQSVKEKLSARTIYNVVTPEAIYKNVTFVGLSIDRSQESGAGLIVADIQLQEVRQTVNVAFTKTKDPASAAPYNQGAVQTIMSPSDFGVIQ